MIILTGNCKHLTIVETTSKNEILYYLGTSYFVKSKAEEFYTIFDNFDNLIASELSRTNTINLLSSTSVFDYDYIKLKALSLKEALVLLENYKNNMYIVHNIIIADSGSVTIYMYLVPEHSQSLKLNTFLRKYSINNILKNL